MSTAGRAPLRAFARRRSPRCPLAVPVRVTVLRAGTAYSLPGRSMDLGEGGIAVVLAGDIRTSDSVGIEFLLPHLGLGLQAKAVVRHHTALRCGLEFRGLTRHQQAVIREWARQSLKPKTSPPIENAEVEESQQDFTDSPTDFYRWIPKTSQQWLWVVGAIFLIAVLIFWWRWQSAWWELEEKVHQSVGQSMILPNRPSEHAVQYASEALQISG